MVAVLFLAVVTATGMATQVITISFTGNQTVASSDEPAADKLRLKGIDEMSTKPDQAIQMFQTAQKQYQYVLIIPTIRPSAMLRKIV